MADDFITPQPLGYHTKGNKPPRGCSSVGRAKASQALGRGFEPLHPLQIENANEY
jgi:hypothetical protein